MPGWPKGSPVTRSISADSWISPTTSSRARSYPRQRAPPRWRRPVSCGRRRQGQPPASPTSPTASPSNTDSGSATPLPPAARSDSTTRRWALRHAAPGKRPNVTSVNWATTHKASRSPRSALATCRATSSAMACCARTRCNSWPPSTTDISSLTRIQTRQEASSNGNGCSICRVRRGTTTTKR